MALFLGERSGRSRAPVGVSERRCCGAGPGAGLCPRPVRVLGLVSRVSSSLSSRYASVPAARTAAFRESVMFGRLPRRPEAAGLFEPGSRTGAGLGRRSVLLVTGTSRKSSSLSRNASMAAKGELTLLLLEGARGATGGGLTTGGAFVLVLLFLSLSSSLSSSKPVAKGSGLPLRRAVCTRRPLKCFWMS